MNGLKDFLSNPAPWSRRSVRWFWAAAVTTLVMILLAYLLLWLGVEGKVPAAIALSGQGVALLGTLMVCWAAYRARRQDIISRQS
ncbi:MAG: hypothetical protein OWU84_02585 [Firmicutes bacterium]|nr:hypothetical protein [Bacillota bacterium]